MEYIDKLISEEKQTKDFNLLVRMSFDDNAIFSMPTKLIDNLVQTKNNLMEKKKQMNVY
jgi:hypothetical protein